MNRCPSPLVCIGGDCWQVPDKPIRRQWLKDSVPDSFVISNAEWSGEVDSEGKAQTKLYRSPKMKTNRRFIGRHPVFAMTAELLERTTMESTSEEARNSMFDVRKKTFKAEEPQLAPSSVSELYSTTRVRPLTSTAPPPGEDDGLPPAPPPGDVITTDVEWKWPEISVEEKAKAFTKMIELPTEQVLKPIPRVEKTSEEVPTAAESHKPFGLDPVEFPISSQLEELAKEGIPAEAPKALSVRPTEEEVESQRNFEKALEERKRRREKARRRSQPHSTTTTRKPILITTSISPTSSEHHSFPLTKQENVPGVWYSMEENNIRRSPETGRNRAAKPASTSNPLKGTDISSAVSDTKRQSRGPIRIDSVVSGRLENECSVDVECGSRSRCCTKRWCDKGGSCSTARFCLPSCSSSKLIKPGRIDIVYD